MMPHTADGAARDDRVSSATAPCAASEGTPALPLTVVSPLHGLPDARLVSSRVEGTGEVHRVLFSAGAAYELLRTIRDAQYGTIKAAVPLRALPDGTFARTADSAVVKVFYKKLYRANWGRLSKSHISEDARSELTTWAHLSTGEGHINVARLMDVCQDKTHVFAVTEFARGGDLFDYLETRKFRVAYELMQCLAAQAADSVAYLHVRRVAHRDVSLENMVLAQAPTGEAVVKMIDFGLARLLPHGPHDATPTHLTARRSGKVAYMAPEVYAANGLYDPFAADVWALGVALFIMCTGCQPYDTPVTSLYKEEAERFKKDHERRQKSRSGEHPPAGSVGIASIAASSSAAGHSIGTGASGSTMMSASLDEEDDKVDFTPGGLATDASNGSAPDRPRAPSYASSLGAASSTAGSDGSVDEEVPPITCATTSPPETPTTMFDLIASARVLDAMRVCGASDALVTAVGPLLQAMLQIKPARRPTAQQVRSYPWIAQAPRPAPVQASPAPCAQSVHELAARVALCMPVTCTLPAVEATGRVVRVHTAPAPYPEDGAPMVPAVGFQ